jgi:hypothetical protein
MAKNNDRPGVVHSLLGGLILTIVLVILVPAITAWLVTPIVEEHFGDIEFSVFTTEMIVGAIMLLVMILFLLLLGGGRIFKKYGIIGIIGLVIAYWLLGNVWDALLPIVIIIIMVAFANWRDSRKK